MTTPTAWYIVKQPNGQCAITSTPPEGETATEQWGPFASESEAIARRVGLIRAGKCQPA
ncbi:MAG: hypothetical protein IGS50_10810 [Synechococcales cyanobacterium C42_A2020_086]|jgi:hypothetical protein|nr:hypothetical protein [Synechococcales cyanobacterium C42_A2020_086]